MVDSTSPGDVSRDHAFGRDFHLSRIVDRMVLMGDAREKPDTRPSEPAAQA